VVGAIYEKDLSAPIRLRRFETMGGRNKRASLSIHLPKQIISR
jgi:hypothetical protein